MSQNLSPFSYKQGQIFLLRPVPYQQGMPPQGAVSTQVVAPNGVQQSPQFAQPQGGVQANCFVQISDQNNSKLKSVKQKFLTHYVDGQIILESTKGLIKKVKPKGQRTQALQNQPQQSLPQQQPQQQLQATPLQPQTLPQPPPGLQQTHLPQAQLQLTPTQQQLPPPQPRQLPPLSAPRQQLQQQRQQQQNHQQQQIQPQPQQQQPQQPQQPQQHQPHQPISQQTQQQSSQLSQLKPDISRLRQEMPNWSVSQVVEFIERHDDIKQYSSKFAEDEIDGKALMIMIDRNLNFQILTSMFKHGPAMKIEATLSKYKTSD